MFDLLLYGVFPYVALALAIAGGVYRYNRDRFSYSAFSTQFLENRQLFLGSVSWHYGIIVLLIGHLVGFLAPDALASFNGVPLRRYILEITAFGMGLFSLYGIIALIWRRITVSRIRVVTSRMDVVLLALLLVQVLAGTYTALFHRWGMGWFVSNAVPYLMSLVTLNPQIQYATTLPFATQIHVVNFFVLVAIFPYSRLVHIVTVPVTYLWRPYQQVLWNRRRRAAATQEPL